MAKNGIIHNMIVGFKLSLITVLAGLILLIPNMFIEVGVDSISSGEGSGRVLLVLGIAVAVGLMVKGWLTIKWKDWIFR